MQYSAVLCCQTRCRFSFLLAFCCYILFSSFNFDFLTLPANLLTSTVSDMTTARVLASQAEAIVVL